jgi:hypothetical protein
VTTIVEGVLKRRERRWLLWSKWHRTCFWEKVSFRDPNDRYFLPGNFVLSVMDRGREVRATIRYEGRLVMGTTLSAEKVGIPFRLTPRDDVVLEGSVRLQ